MGRTTLILAGLLLQALLTPAQAATFDRSFLPVCARLAAGEAIADLESHPTVQKLKMGFGDAFAVSPEVVTQNGDRLEAYLKGLDSIEASLPKLAADATLFTGPSLPADLRINLVCGTGSDGYGFRVEGNLELFLDLTRIDPDFMPHLLMHELWHVAFRTAHPDIEASFDRKDVPYKRLAFVMLNEGVGHYYSFRRRLEPVISYPDWQARTDVVFAMLDTKFLEYQSASGQEDQEPLLWPSHAGVPFWEKWAAVPGAIITYRLRGKLGDDALKDLIASGPCAFLSRYQAEAGVRQGWQKLPEGLISAACPAEPRAS